MIIWNVVTHILCPMRWRSSPGILSGCLNGLVFIFFLQPFFLLSSLPPPSCLELEHHNSVDLSVWRELVFVNSCLQGPFHQVKLLITLSVRERKLGYVSARWCHLLKQDYFENQSCTLCKCILSCMKTPRL